MAVKLLGSETVGATGVETAKEIAASFKYVGLISGVLEVLKFKITQAAASAQTYDIGIYEDAAGVPGELLGHKTVVSLAEVAEQTLTVSGFSIAIVASRIYHLAALDKTAAYKTKYTKEAAHEDVRKATVGKVELKKGSESTWTAVAESNTTGAPFWGEGTEDRPSPLWNLHPPSFGTPRDRYKPFPGPEAARAVVAEVVFGKASGTLLLTGTSTGITAQKVTGSATGALLLTGTSKATVINKVLASATGALLLTGTSHGVAIQKVTASAAGALLLTGTSVGIVRNVVIGKASGTLFLLGSGHVLEPKAEVGKRIAIFIFED